MIQYRYRYYINRYSMNIGNILCITYIRSGWNNIPPEIKIPFYRKSSPYDIMYLTNVYKTIVLYYFSLLLHLPLLTMSCN